MKKPLTAEQIYKSKDYYIVFTDSKNKLKNFVKKDHYYYDKFGNKTNKKFFQPRYRWKYFWEPCLDDIAKIERVYFKLSERIASINDEASKILSKISKSRKNIIRDVYGTRVHIAHYYNEKTKNYGFFKVENETYSCEYCDFKPTAFKNLNEGNELNRLDDKRHQLYILRNKIKDVLILAINKKTLNKDKYSIVKRDMMIDISVNGREYILLNNDLQERYNLSKKYPTYEKIIIL